MQQVVFDSNTEDVIIWKDDKKEGFSVKKCYEKLQNEMCEQSGEGIIAEYPTKYVWNEIVPTKVSFNAWAASHGSLPTVDVLIRRGMILGNRCILCFKEAESNNHLMLHCDMVIDHKYDHI